MASRIIIAMLFYIKDQRTKKGTLIVIIESLFVRSRCRDFY